MDKKIGLIFDVDGTITPKESWYTLFSEREKDILLAHPELKYVNDYFSVLKGPPDKDTIDSCYLNTLLDDMKIGGPFVLFSKRDLYELGKRVPPAKNLSPGFHFLNNKYGDSISIHLVSTGEYNVIRGFVEENSLSEIIDVYTKIIASEFEFDSAGTCIGVSKYIGSEDKPEVVNDIIQRESIEKEDVIVIGDGKTDLKKFSASENPICVYNDIKADKLREKLNLFKGNVEKMFFQDYTPSSPLMRYLSEIISLKLDYTPYENTYKLL